MFMRMHCQEKFRILCHKKAGSLCSSLQVLLRWLSLTLTVWQLQGITHPMSAPITDVASVLCEGMHVFVACHISKYSPSEGAAPLRVCNMHMLMVNTCSWQTVTDQPIAAANRGGCNLCLQHETVQLPQDLVGYSMLHRRGSIPLEAVKPVPVRNCGM